MCVMRILLAPMQGLVDAPMRALLTSMGGVDACVTEFVRVTHALLPARTFYRLCPELHHGGCTPSGVPVSVQLLGSDPACLADNAARAAELGAPAVDLNFGCPAPTVNRHRGGAVLLREPELLHAIVRAVRAATPAQVPVTAKMRLGYDDTALALDCAQALATAGDAEIVVHARTKTEGYRPPAHWDWIARIREAVTVNVVANGEIWTLQDAQRCLEISGSQDLMLGRGLVARPDLAGQIASWASGRPEVVLDWPGMRLVVTQFWGLLQAYADGAYPQARLKQWLALVAQAFPAARPLLESVRRQPDSHSVAACLADDTYWQVGR